MFDPDKMIVKGADGFYYYVTQTGPLERVPAGELQAFQAAIPTIQAALDALFVEQMENVMAGCHQSIQIVIPDVDLP